MIDKDEKKRKKRLQRLWQVLAVVLVIFFAVLTVKLALNPAFRNASFDNSLAIKNLILKKFK